MKMNQSQQHDFIEDEVVCLPYDIVPLSFPTKLFFDQEQTYIGKNLVEYNGEITFGSK
jgi:hypothetical protein